MPHDLRRPIGAMHAIGAGTLVVVVPTAEGLVIAADSRITVFPRGHAELYCDNVFKIVEISGAARTAFVVTGYSTVWNFENVPAAEVCEYIAGGNHTKFDANVILKEAIERTPSIVDAALDHLPTICVDALSCFSASYPGDYEPRRGLQVFQVTICTFDPVSATSRLQQFAIDMAADGQFSASGFTVSEYRPDDECQLLLMGEVNYLIEHVFGGVGRAFLGERYGRFRNSMTVIREADFKLAADFATDIVEAAAKTTALFAAPTGIGGPVDVLLLGKDERPQKLRWKG